VNKTDDLLNLFYTNSNFSFNLECINKKNLDDIIYLTENGFSKPIGTYDFENKIAKLDKSIFNKILIIDIDNITLNGNNHSIKNDSLDITLIISKKIKNINIEYLNLNSNSIDIFIEPFCENIKFNNCIFNSKDFGIISFLNTNLSINSCKFFNNTGITLYSCKETLINSNYFYSNNNGIYLSENNNNSNINDNLFLNCIYGVSMDSKNNFNIISNNKFKNENTLLQQYCISMINCNHYNKVSKNLITFTHKSINYDVGSLPAKLIGIYIESNKNTFNTISENKIIFKNNKYNFNNTHPNILISGISCFGSNSDLEISNNEIEVSQNEFNMENGNSQSILIYNIYISNHSNCSIKNNIFNISKNTLNLNLKNSLSEINNLVLDKNNKSIKIFGNKFEIFENNSLNNETLFKYYNLSLLNKNSDTDIKDNIFKIKSNNNSSIASVLFSNKNYGNKLLYNKFLNIEGVSIILDNENIGNIIMYNDINCNNFTILLSDGNNSNIIKENYLSTVASSNILLLINNMDNLISENYIENEFLGVFLLKNNKFNTIIFNEFSKISHDISNSDDSYNYIFNNNKKL